MEDEGQIVDREQYLQAGMTVCEVPIYCEESERNVPATVFERTTQSRVAIVNSGSTAYRVAKEDSSYIEVSLSMCFVQQCT